MTETKDGGPMVRANSLRKQFWWIFSPSKEEWGGIRFAAFLHTMNGKEICHITGEYDRDRIGIRLWDHISKTEGWIKVKQVMVPTKAELQLAILANKEMKDAEQRSETDDHSGSSEPG